MSHFYDRGDRSHLTDLKRHAKPEFEAYVAGATIGVLGGGQLGRMMAVVARQMGLLFTVCMNVGLPHEDDCCRL